MTDVVKMALARHSELKKQIAEFDDFIRTAEKLIRSAQAGGGAAETDPIQARFCSGEALSPVEGDQGGTSRLWRAFPNPG